MEGEGGCGELAESNLPHFALVAEVYMHTVLCLTEWDNYMIFFILYFFNLFQVITSTEGMQPLVYMHKCSRIIWEFLAYFT